MPYNINRYYKGLFEAIEVQVDNRLDAEETLGFLQEEAEPGVEFELEEV
jgi:hypothetical protein